MSLLRQIRRSTSLQAKPEIRHGRAWASQNRYQSTTSSANSVNPDELSHFNKLAATWWDPHGPSRLLHQMNPLRHDFIRTCFSEFPAGPEPKSYLDVGCGGGIFAESAARLQTSRRVCAVDPSKEVISVANRHARLDPLFADSGRLEYINQPLEEIPLPAKDSERYDVVSLFEVLEHVTYPSAFLHSCLPFVKPGGWLVGSTIARTWTSYLTTKLVAEEVVGLVPRGTHEWEKYINAAELQDWFARQDGWGSGRGTKIMGAVYMPGLGWKAVSGAEGWGNYFFGVRRNLSF